MSDADRIKELERQLEAAQECQIKFGKKDNVCFYIPGRRFPITLYAPAGNPLTETVVCDATSFHK